MRAEVIRAVSIHAAAEQIIDALKEDTSGSMSNRKNAIYFDGWDGLGAGAVLRAVAQRLALQATASSSEQVQFDQIIHVDCSKWESRRALQRAIAEQLKLPAELMGMFDSQDEEDDFDGVGRGSRAEIPQVLKAMHRRVKELNRRFLVILHNGSSQEIDLASFGFPLSEYYSKVLWTFQGRFRHYPRAKVVGAMRRAGMKADAVFLSAYHGLWGREAQELWSVLVRQEAVEFAQSSSSSSDITIETAHGPAQVSECFFSHLLKLCCIGHNLQMDFDLATHACNYWLCDGIIQQRQEQGDPLWRAADALQRDVRLDADYYQYDTKNLLPPQLVPYGTSMMSSQPCSIASGAIPNGDMFQDFDQLGVLKLSRRTFSFSSPPFIHCHNLKFLWLDHCQDQDHQVGGIDDDDLFHQQDKKDRSIISTDGAEDFRRFFQGLLVLDIRYTGCDWFLSPQMMDLMAQLRELNVMGATDWDMGPLQGRLPNIRKLRVTKSSVRTSEDDDLSLGMNKMELLDFSGNRVTSGMKSLSAGNTSSRLETVIIGDGCVGLEKISVRGCSELKNLFLTGNFEHLCSLDVSGTAVTTLDLSGMASLKLDELLLLGCHELCVILWPSAQSEENLKLRLVTTESASAVQTGEQKAAESQITAAGSSSSLLPMVRSGRRPSEFVLLENMPCSDFDWYISVRDARLLRSLVHLKHYLDTNIVALEISCPNYPAANAGDDMIKSDIDSIEVYGDNTIALDDLRQQASKDHGDTLTIKQIWSMFRYEPPSCYMFIQDQPNLRLSREAIITIPDVICNNTRILHVHDSLAVAGPASRPQVSPWNWLVWCRVERCPNLDSVFTIPKEARECIFANLLTIWVSQLPKARFIWSLTVELDRATFTLRRSIYEQSFESLQFLHVDFCPRLLYVLPLPLSKVVGSGYFRRLVTLQIMWCGDLKEVFPVYIDTFPNHRIAQVDFFLSATQVDFDSLKRIHLQELPMLQSICGDLYRIKARQLETVKIKGCWSLKRLPAIRTSSWISNKEIECECEKEWWDNLQWDGTGSHFPGLYKPTHPRYHKETLLRSSVLK